MVAANSAIRLPKFSGRKKAAFLRRAKGLGLSPATYLQRLIDADLRQERMARSKSLRVLTAPLSMALRGLSEDDMDALVDKARRSGTRS